MTLIINPYATNQGYWSKDITTVSGTLHLATKDGEAMFFHDSINFSSLEGRKIVFTDAAAKTATAYGYRAGTGEALDVNVVDAFVYSDYDTFTTSNNDISSAIALTDKTCYFRDSFSGDNGALYKLLISALTINSGVTPQSRVSLQTNLGSPILFPTMSTAASYVTLTSTATWYIGGRTTAKTNYALTDFTFCKLTNVNSTGMLLVSARGGSTRNMTSVDSGFNPNAVTKVTVYDVPLKIVSGAPAMRMY